MTKKNRFKSRRRALHERMVEIEQRWRLAHTRGRDPFRQLRALFEAGLTTSTLLAREALIDQHRLKNVVRLNVAMAEVDQFYRDIVEDLRRNGGMPLIHPVTEYGFANADKVDPDDSKAIAKCVPGLGAGGAMYGWRRAHLEGDPVWMAYVQHRYHSGKLAVDHSVRLRTEGAVAGLLPVGTMPLLPERIA